MARKSTEEGHREVVLRTTASVVADVVEHMNVCAELWPEFTDDAQQLRDIAIHLEATAEPYGYRPRQKSLGSRMCPRCSTLVPVEARDGERVRLRRHLNGSVWCLQWIEPST